MKRMMMIAVALSMCLCKADVVKDVEVYIAIPGEKVVHTIATSIEFKEHGIVVVKVPWGAVYTSHVSNVVIVEWSNGKGIGKNIKKHSFTPLQP